MQKIDIGMVLAIVIICALLGFGAGYVIGFGAGLGWSFDKAVWLLDHQGIKIEFDEKMIKTGVLQYNQNIGGCMFTESLENASIYTNEGN